jgi:hypothetical protein
MNLFNKYIQLWLCGLAILCSFIFASCNNIPVGNKFLSKPPTLNFTEDSVFSNKAAAKRLLVNLYATLPYPLSAYGQKNGAPVLSQQRSNGLHWNGILIALTDLAFTHYSPNAATFYYNGTFNANSSADQRIYSFYQGRQWLAFYEGWTLINNIDRVPNMSNAEKERWKAEAKTIMALHYVNMYRLIGGIVWVGKAYSGDSKVPEHPRLTAMASIDSICGLLDQAIPHLPGVVPQSQLGRMTKVGAEALKVRALLFAASPLFNSTEPYMQGEAAAKKLIWMGGYHPELWKRAKKAAKKTIQMIDTSSYYGMVEPAARDSAGYREAYRKGYYDRGSGETLISLRASFTGLHNSPVAAKFDKKRWAVMECPTENYTEMFPDKNGVPIKKSKLYNSKHPYWNRDPRLYETLVVNGDVWGNRPAQLWIGGRDRPSKVFGAATGGYLIRKYIISPKRRFYRTHTNQFSYIRVPEIYLSYAEALSKINDGPTPEAYKYVNMVRHRVGLGNIQKSMENPNSEKEFIHKVLKERAREFGYENLRWYDMVRWKRKDLFTKKLTGLNLFKNKDGSFNFQKYNVSKKFPRYWQTNFSPKWYLQPIPQKEINKNYGMIQNPGW